MSERDPNIVTSSLSGPVTRDSVTVDVQVYRLEHEPGWRLEVVNARGTSTVWEATFDTDDEAHAAFLVTVADEGMTAFLDQATVVPFRR